MQRGPYPCVGYVEAEAMTEGMPPPKAWHTWSRIGHELYLCVGGCVSGRMKAQQVTSRSKLSMRVSYVRIQQMKVNDCCLVLSPQISGGDLSLVDQFVGFTCYTW